MNLQSAYWIWSLTAGIITASLAVFLWVRITVAKASSLIVLMSAVALWCLSYAAEFTSPLLAAKIFWVKIEYLGAVAVPPTMLVFVLNITGLGSRVHRLWLAATWVVPLVTLFITWTNGQHHLMWRFATLNLEGPTPILQYLRGPWFWVHISYSYLLVLIGTVLLLLSFIRARHLFRKQVGAMLLGVMAPWLANAAYVFNLNPFNQLDFTPLAFTFTGLTFAWGVLRFHLFSIIPVARAAVMESMKEAVLVTDAHHRIADLNQAAARLLGSEGRFLVGKRAATHLPGWVDPGAADSKRAQPMREVVINQDGQRRYFEQRVAPLAAKGSSTLGHLIILSDITERKKAYEQSLRQVSYLQNLQEIDAVIRQTEDPEQTVNAVLDAVMKMFGCDRVWLLYPCDPQRDAWQVTMEIYNPRYPGISQAGGQLLPDEEIRKGLREFLECDGPLIYYPEDSRVPQLQLSRMGVRSVLAMAVYPKIGEPWLFGMHQCSHRRQWTQEEKSLFKDIAHRVADALEHLIFYRNLRESEERFRSLSENAPDLIYALNQEGVITYVNPACREILGYRPEEVIGRYFDVLSPENLFQNYKDSFRDILAGQGVLKERVGTLLHKQGHRRIFSMSGAPWRDVRGQVIGIIGICKDITEQRHLESQLRQSQKMEAVGTLAGGIAHDFNNILQVIFGYTQLLSNSPSCQGHDADYLHQVERAAGRATELINRLLIFSRKEKPILQPVDLNHEVVGAVRMLERTIPKMIQIQTSLARDLWLVDGDSNQLEQVLMNLGANASDAMPEGGRLSIETANLVLDQAAAGQNPDLSPGEYVLMRVSDTGRGIQPQQMEHIFEPFFTTKEVGKGTGLGLSTVYGIVKGHGGAITCQSTPGQGTAFSVYLPALSRQEDAPRRAQRQAVSMRGGSETVLVVDDEPAILSMARDALQGHGYRVLTAGTGEESLEIFGAHGPEIDLVILDRGMPGMGGDKTLAELLRINPEARVIVSTGYLGEDNTTFALQEGAVGFLGKPYSLNGLLQKVREVLDRTG